MARWMGPLGLYVPGTGPIHRCPAGIKFLALVAVTVALSMTRSLLLAVIGLVVTLALTAAAGIAPLRQWRSLRRVLLSLAPLGAFVWWQYDWRTATEMVFDLAAAILLAALMTATTRADVLVAALAKATQPLDRWGFSSERFALAIALMLRAIPALFETLGEVRDAARARGLERSPHAYLVPLALKTVARAHLSGDALAARGL